MELVMPTASSKLLIVKLYLIAPETFDKWRGQKTVHDTHR